MADKQELLNVEAALAKAELMAALSDATRARLRSRRRRFAPRERGDDGRQTNPWLKSRDDPLQQQHQKPVALGKVRKA